MRILFYIEPHPIRNSMTHFKDIARQMAALINPQEVFDIRLYANRETIGHLPEAERTRLKDNILEPSIDEQDYFLSQLRDWDGGGMADWVELMRAGPIAERYRDILASIWHRFPFDVILHWGENGAVRLFAETTSITAIAMELGCTRPPFLNSSIFDLFGTNGNALIPKLTIQELDSIVAGRGLPAQTSLLAFSENLESIGYEKQFAPLNDEVSARIAGKRFDKIAFLPLQLYDDANLLLFSRYASITDVVLDVVPKLAENGYLVLIKPHPASKHRVSAIRENRAARAALRQWESSIVWCDPDKENFKNAQLIGISDLVVTVNSSVGFEATYFDKPVVVLGGAVYKPQGLFPDLEAVLDGTFDRTEYLRNISLLRRFLLEAYLLPNSMVRDPSRFRQHILALVEISSESNGMPFDVAQSYFANFSAPQRRQFTAAMAAGHSRAGSNNFSLPAFVSESKLEDPAVSGLNLSFNKAKVVHRLMQLSGKDNKDALSEFLREHWHNPEFRLGIIEELGLLDADFYLAENRDVAEAEMDPRIHFVLYGEAEGRSPHPHINLTEFLRTRDGSPKTALMLLLIELIQNASFLKEAEDAYGDMSGDEDEDSSPTADGMIARFPLAEREEAALAETHAMLRQRLSVSQNKIAVVTHLYYRDLVPEVLERLALIPVAFDLIVTLPEWGAEPIEALVAQKYPDTIFCRMPNRGRDIGPFIEILPHLIERKYQAVLKLQSKKGYYVAGRMLPRMGEAWRKIAFQSLLGSAEKIRKILWAFGNIPTVNMVGPGPFYLSLAAYPYHDDGYLAASYLDGNLRPGKGFFAGTMFWFRPTCLAPLVTGPNALRLDAFEPENSANDGQLAHLVERLFGQLAGSGTRIGAMDAFTEEADLELGLTPSGVKIHDFLTGVLADKPKPEKSLLW